MLDLLSYRACLLKDCWVLGHDYFNKDMITSIRTCSVTILTLSSSLRIPPLKEQKVASKLAGPRVSIICSK